MSTTNELLIQLLLKFDQQSQQIAELKNAIMPDKTPGKMLKKYSAAWYSEQTRLKNIRKKLKNQ